MGIKRYDQVDYIMIVGPAGICRGDRVYSEKMGLGRCIDQAHLFFSVEWDNGVVRAYSWRCALPSAPDRIRKCADQLTMAGVA